MTEQLIDKRAKCVLKSVDHEEHDEHIAKVEGELRSLYDERQSWSQKCEHNATIARDLGARLKTAEEELRKQKALMEGDENRTKRLLANALFRAEEEIRSLKIKLGVKDL